MSLWSTKVLWSKVKMFFFKSKDIQKPCNQEELNFIQSDLILKGNTYLELVIQVDWISKIVLNFQRKANYGFRLPDPLACKHLWKCAVEHLAFYRWRQTKGFSILTAINQSINQSRTGHCFSFRHLLNIACLNVTVKQTNRSLHVKTVFSIDRTKNFIL